jgi:hypothetical protein
MNPWSDIKVRNIYRCRLPNLLVYKLRCKSKDMNCMAKGWQEVGQRFWWRTLKRLLFY